VSAEITVFSRNPENTLSKHDINRAIPVRNLTRLEAINEIKRLDVFILGGGGILYDGEAETYLREVMIAHEYQIPVMIYAISAGPLKKISIRNMVKDALNQVRYLTVRDRHGRRLLEDIGIQKEIHLTADPAFILEPEPISPDTLNSEGIDVNKKLVGFSVREPGPAAPDMDVDHYHSLVANAADFMIHRLDADIVFVPMERKMMDVQHSHAVVSKMHAALRATILKGEYSPRQILGLMKFFQFVVGMRLHFLIFAAREGVPFVPLPYATKVTGFIEDLEMEMPPLGDVNAGELIAHIDRAWDYREVMKQKILNRIPLIQDRARQTHRFLAQLLEELSHAPPKSS
jgi:polysaccharide pyruvyl transferase CsaB